MNKFVRPGVGAVLAMIGTFTPLVNGPAGAALIFAGLLSIFTMPRKKDVFPRRKSILAFNMSVVIAVILSIFHLAIFRERASPSEAWASTVIASSIAVFTVIGVIAVYYIVRWMKISKERNDPASGYGSRIIRALSALLPPTLWVGFGFLNVFLTMMMVAYVTMNSLSPAVSHMMTELNKDPETVRERVIVKDGMASLMGTGIIREYEWSCSDDVKTIMTDGVAHEVNDTDILVLSSLCEKDEG